MCLSEIGIIGGGDVRAYGRQSHFQKSAPLYQGGGSDRAAKLFFFLSNAHTPHTQPDGF